MRTFAHRFMTFLLIFALCRMSSYSQSSWTTPVRVDPLSTQFQFSPLIAVGPQRHLAVACGEGSPGVVIVYRSIDNGRNFLRTQLPSPSAQEFEINQTESLSFDADGNLYLLWSWNETPGGIGLRQWLVLSKSTDGGESFSTFWANAQPVFNLRRHKMIVTPDRTVHLIRDSLVPPPETGMEIYVKFTNGNPANKIELMLPKPSDTVYTRLEADMLFSQGMIHYACYGFTSSLSQLRTYYTRSTNGGSTFFPMVQADSCFPQFGISSSARPILFGGWNEELPYPHGVLGAKYISDSLTPFSSLFRIGSKWFDPAGTTVRFQTSSSENYLIYGGVDTQSVTSFYQYGDLKSSATDSMFFPLLQSPDFALDSLGGKYIVAGHQREHRLFFSSKDILSRVEEEPYHPVDAVLYQNYPNPFNPSTRIDFRLANRQYVKLSVYDVLGREMTRLVDGVQSSGLHNVSWNSSSASSGIYFYKLYFGGTVISTKKMALIH